MHISEVNAGDPPALSGLLFICFPGACSIPQPSILPKALKWGVSLLCHVCVLRPSLLRNHFVWMCLQIIRPETSGSLFLFLLRQLPKGKAHSGLLFPAFQPVGAWVAGLAAASLPGCWCMARLPVSAAGSSSAGGQVLVRCQGMSPRVSEWANKVWREKSLPDHNYIWKLCFVCPL